MELAVLVYTISLLGSLNSLLTAFMLIAIVAFVVCGMIAVINWDSSGVASYEEATREQYKMVSRTFGKHASRAAILASVLAIVLALVPSEKTAYVMVGAYAAQKVAENPEVQRMSSKVLNIIELKLDEYIEDTTKAVEK